MWNIYYSLNIANYSVWKIEQQTHEIQKFKKNIIYSDSKFNTHKVTSSTCERRSILFLLNCDVMQNFKFMSVINMSELMVENSFQSCFQILAD